MRCKSNHFFCGFTLCALLCLAGTSRVWSAQPTEWVVVIDAGHGGKDPGAVSGKVYEKHINLSVALALGALLEEQIKGIKIVYTRADDRFIELAQRTQIANKADADLFVSIHTNANPGKAVSGTETYVMGVDKTNANMAVSMRENGVISLESDYQSRYEGYDPKSPESLIMFSLMQYAYQTQSLELAQAVEMAYKGAGRSSRGVHQAGFLVLWRTAMPSILTEVGFVSNDNDRAFLTSKEGPRKLAAALADAVINYLRGRQKPTNVKIKKQAPATTATHTATPVAAPKKEPQASSKEELYYSIQIRTSATPIPINSANFGPLVMRLREAKVGATYKYWAEKAKTYQEALSLQRRLREIYPDAFVVAFRGVEQISVSEAQKSTK